MISGWAEYMDVETGEISEFHKGDFYAITIEKCLKDYHKKNSLMMMWLSIMEVK